MNKSSIKSLASLKTGTSFESDTLKYYSEPTFALKVRSAQEKHKQGDFNGAMLALSETNRDQVLAIREIQQCLDQNNNREHKHVVLSKFKQTEPYELGITDGEDVLELLKEVEDTESALLIGDIHRLEQDHATAFEEYTFYQNRMKGRVSEEELQDMHGECSTLKHDLIEAKLDLIEHIEEVIKKYNFSDAVLLAKVVRSCYRILTSSIATRHAHDVDAEIFSEEI